MRVLLTGAAGNLGSEALPHLLEAGHEVRTFELATKLTRKVLAPYAGRSEQLWGDLCDAGAVARAVEGVDAIVHNGALPLPMSEVEPERAERINVGGTRNLLESARAQPTPPRFLYPSSIAVYGITQPHLPPPRRVNEPLSATDHYSHHKIACEQLVRDSGLRYCIMRIAVAPPRAPRGGDPALLRFMFRSSLDSRAEYVHPADVGLAQARALGCDDAWNKVLLIGGGPRCHLTNRALINGLLEHLGIGALPDSAFGAEPLYGDWLDTEESERLLRYQRHTYDDFLAELALNVGLARFGVRLMRPFARRFLLRFSEAYSGRA